MNLTEIQLVNKKLLLPNFIPSISSIKTNYHPIDYLRLMSKIKYPHFLISAYDIYYSFNSFADAFTSLMNQANSECQIIFLDSGNYEHFWNRFNPWDSRLYFRKLNTLNVDFSFSYDGKGVDQNVVDSICTSVLEQEKYAGNSIIIPISQVSPEHLVKKAFEIAKKLDPLLIAIPERILGEGILKRAKMLKSVREKLNSLGKYYPIHLLGTGNPRSILIYIYAGADCFDGLEWCQTFIEPITGILYHFQQGEIFLKSDDDELNYATKVLLTNLKYYHSFIDEVQNGIINKSFDKILGKYFENDFINRLKKEVDG